MIQRKNKYIARLAIDVGGVRQVIRTKRFKSTSPMISFGKDISFQVDISAPEYQSRNRIYYLFERGKGQITTYTIETGRNEKIVKSLFLDELPKQLVTAMNRSQGLTSELWLYVVLALGAGVGIGWIICQAYLGM